MSLITHTPQLRRPIESTPFNEWIFPDGTLWASFYHAEDGYLLRFPKLADFTISIDGQDIEAYPMPAVPLDTIEHLYLNQVLPLALSRQFKLVLHASAVEIEQYAVAFLGESEMGKSTLAASFSTSGYRFLTDDGLQLEKKGDDYLVLPSDASIRLWDDSRQALIPENVQQVMPVVYTPKIRLVAGGAVVYCDQPRRLHSLFFLGNSCVDALRMEPISGGEAMMGLVKNCFLLDIKEREMLTYHFEELSGLANEIQFFRLDYPRRYEILPKVREAIIEHVIKTG